ncbi:hypothetical protein ACHAW5_008833 [Stephanodiscus triporus]|uniref:WRKY19-like zinc finger domain-containing protein n=1 Tax=Stephanodiscus triporus TaxID=2934178 RepID=A0ABD3MDS8_9STRA
MKQRERNRRAAEDRAAEEKRESENIVCLAATPAAFAPLLSELADEEETLISVKVKAKDLCCFEGCDNQIRAGGVCSRHGAKQTRRTCSMEGCTNQARSKGDLCVTHGAKTKRCSHEGCTKQVVRGGKCTGHAESAKNICWFVQHRGMLRVGYHDKRLANSWSAGNTPSRVTVERE